MLGRLLARRVALAWLLLALIVGGATVVVLKLTIFDAPPAGSLFVLDSQAEGASATITPFKAAQAPAVSTPTLAATSLVSQTTTIAVYVSGEVAKPGVYSLPAGSRVSDAVTAAGGALPDADLEDTNMAQKLADADHITIPRSGAVEATPNTVPAESAAPGEPTVTVAVGGVITPTVTPMGTAKVARTPTASTAAKILPGTKINLNTASAEQLELLPGIGPALAARIISDRKQNGPYKTVEDLTRVSGIKEGILSKIRDYVTVGP